MNAAKSRNRADGAQGHKQEMIENSRIDEILHLLNTYIIKIISYNLLLPNNIGVATSPSFQCGATICDEGGDAGD